MSRTKLQRILNKLDGKNEATVKVIEDFDIAVRALRDKLDKDITVATLDEVNKKINQLRKSFDISHLLTQVGELKAEFRQNAILTLNEVESKTEELRKQISGIGNSLIESKRIETENLSKSFKEEISGVRKESANNLTQVNNTLSQISNKIQDFPERKELMFAIKEVKKEKSNSIDEFKVELDKTRIELINRINNKGGGQANRNIMVGSNPSTLSKYGDINLKAGANVTITYSQNNTLKTTDITIASSGGGGSVVGGTVRSVNNVSTSQVMGSVVGTDYVYIASAGVKLDLPPDVATNTNLYTIKNVSNSSILVTGTIDNDVNGVIMPIKYTSVDIISNSVDWNIT